MIMINPSPTSAQPVEMNFQTDLACYLGGVQRGPPPFPTCGVSALHWLARSRAARGSCRGRMDALDWNPAKASPAGRWTLVQGPAPGKQFPKFQQLHWWVWRWSSFWVWGKGTGESGWADGLAMELIAERKLTGCESFFDIAIPFADLEWWMEVGDPFLRPLVMDTGCFLLSTGAWNEVQRAL